MVGFEQKLQASIYPPWADSYLNYVMLKSKIEDIVAAKNNPDEEAARVESALKIIFQGAFDDQVIKFLGFYNGHQRKVSREVAEVQEAMEALPQMADEDELSPEQRLDTCDELARRLQEAGRGVQRLLEFVSLNMQGMRKILKKLAKNVDPSPPVPGHLALEIHHPHDPGWKVLQGTYLKPEVQDDLNAMAMHKELAQAAATIRQLSSQLTEYSRRVLSTCSEDAQEREAHRTLVRMDTLLQDLGSAEVNANRNAAYVQGLSWASTRAGIFEKPPLEEHAVGTNLGIAINCLNSALYMSNYNLLVPSVRSFLTHIGAAPTAAGFVIGCCDLASMPSTVGYSLWTNKQYKLPLMFSGVACLLGNLILALSYDSHSLPLLYLARFVTGVGAARCISRRYIADFVAKSERTAASAAFVGSSALGMALGPLLARVFQSFPASQYHGVTFDAITMGAWTMAVLWVVFLVITIIFFEDPMARVHAAKAATSSHATDDRRQPLLAQASSGEDDCTTAVHSPPHDAVGNGTSKPKQQPKPGLFRQPSFRIALGPTLVCVYALLVLKTAQQAYLDSVPLFTGLMYGWSDGSSGAYVALLCLSMLLVTFTVGYISSRGVSDRALCLVSLLLMLAGSCQLFFGTFPRWSFFTGGVILLVSTIIAEGSFMSLESKVIHPAFAEGTWNAGLLSTEAGTLGRFTGNLLLSVASAITGLQSNAEVANFARVLWTSIAVVVVSNLAWFAYLFNRIATLE